KFGKGRLYSARVPVTIQHRSPQSATYYENKDGAKIVKSSHFDFEYMLGRKITFFCMAQGMPRPEITWFKDGIELYHHKYFQVHEWTEGNDTIKSKMEIDPATQKDAGFYECQANNKYAIDYRAFRTDYAIRIEKMKIARSIALLLIIGTIADTESRRVRPGIRTKSKSQRDLESNYNNYKGAGIFLTSHFDYEYPLGHKIAFICVAKGNPRPHITWFKDSEIFTHPNLHIYEWQIGNHTIKSKLEVDPATHKDAGLYECTAENMHSIDRRSFKKDFSITSD
ncbi:hypothetical protein YQE_06096, partial [Dendroctonus ponderosae]